jgi:hypothetical protein
MDESEEICPRKGFHMGEKFIIINVYDFTERQLSPTNIRGKRRVAYLIF